MGVGSQREGASLLVVGRNHGSRRLQVPLSHSSSTSHRQTVSGHEVQGGGGQSGLKEMTLIMLDSFARYVTWTVL